MDGALNNSMNQLVMDNFTTSIQDPLNIFHSLNNYLIVA